MTDTGHKPTLVPLKRSAQADIVAELEKLLADARSGEITSLAYVVIRPAADVTSGWYTGDDWLRLAGAVAVLQHHVMEGDN